VTNSNGRRLRKERDRGGGRKEEPKRFAVEVV